MQIALEGLFNEISIERSDSFNTHDIYQSFSNDPMTTFALLLEDYLP